MAEWILTNADIVAALPKLADHRERADSGTTTSLVSGRLLDSDTNTIIGSTICFITGDSLGSDAIITSYTPTTGEVVFTAIPEPVGSSTVFGIVYFDFISYVSRAYAMIKNDIKNRGLDIELFLNEAQLKELHLTKTLALICLSKRQDADNEDLYHEAYLLYADNYIKELDNIKADYDVDEDGEIDDEEKNLSFGQVVLTQ